SAEHVTVGWVGDSRAYWLAGPGSALLTRDDAAPGHVLTAWLGADAGEVVPHVQIFAPEGPGVVLGCSDGLGECYPRSVPPPGAGSALLTRDDAAPGQVLTAWLGADAGEVVPHVQIFAPGGPGVVLVCSDGLWNYYPDPVTLAEAVPDAAADPLAAARTLVRL